MSKYEKPKFDESDLGENVFLSSLEVKVNSIKSNDKYRASDVGSEEVFFELANFDYESTPYCKVFVDAERRLKAVGLSTRAQGLLMWLMYEARPGKDWLWLNKVRYMEESKVNSLTTYRTALNELVRKRYIGKTVVADVYWINPHFFFNGNRIKSFPDNIVKK